MTNDDDDVPIFLQGHARFRGVNDRGAIVRRKQYGKGIWQRATCELRPDSTRRFAHREKQGSESSAMVMVQGHPITTQLRFSCSFTYNGVETVALNVQGLDQRRLFGESNRARRLDNRLGGAIQAKRRRSSGKDSNQGKRSDLHVDRVGGLTIHGLLASGQCRWWLLRMCRGRIGSKRCRLERSPEKR